MDKHLKDFVQKIITYVNYKDYSCAFTHVLTWPKKMFVK